MKVYSRGMPTGLQQTQLGDLSVKDFLVVLFLDECTRFL
jgi:hypothetical protein